MARRERGTESSAPIKNGTNGESSSLKKEVRDLVISLRQKARRARQSASPSQPERIAGITVKEALEKYEIHQREEKRDKIQSVLDTIYRLGLLFTDGDALLSGLTPTRCGLLLSNLKQRNTKYGKPFAVDSLKNILAESKTFMNWCVESQGWLKSNPLMKLQVEGKRRHRKFQLHYDEARRWMTGHLNLRRRATSVLWQR